MNRHKLRCYNFSIVYYLDNKNYDFFKVWEIFYDWILYNKYECCYITHDKDEGKSIHVHTLVKMHNQRSIEVIAKELQIPVSDIEIIKTMYGSYRYLTHKDDPDKYAYPDSDIEYLNNFEIPKSSNLNDKLKLYSLTNIVRDIYNNNLTSLQAVTFYYLDNDELDAETKEACLLLISRNNTYIRGILYEKNDTN